MKGKNGSYPVNTAKLPLVPLIVIDPPFATTGQCGEATFPLAPPAKPSCLATGGGSTVTCKERGHARRRRLPRRRRAWLLASRGRLG